MCGVVKKPTRKEDFYKLKFAGISLNDQQKVVELCEETHTPHNVTKLVLGMINTFVQSDDVFVKIPFALYKNFVRFTSAESVAAEAEVMHLAMAGSTLYYINALLASNNVDAHIMMGHCCEIQMIRKSQFDIGLAMSHDGNIFRADQLRNLKSENFLFYGEFLKLGVNLGYQEKYLNLLHCCFATKELTR